MDMLDLIKPRLGFTQRGTYRRYQSDAAQYFDYKDVDFPSNRYGEVMNNLITDSESRVIKTMQNCGYEVNGFVCTQDGKTWTIVSVIGENKNGETLRILSGNPSEEFIIGLQNLENPRNLK